MTISKTKIRGISLERRLERGGTLTERYVASVNHAGRQHRRSWALGKHGPAQALELALRWRRERLAELRGDEN